jgi:hypothetical protein
VGGGGGGGGGMFPAPKARPGVYTLTNELYFLMENLFKRVQLFSAQNANEM